MTFEALNKTLQGPVYTLSPYTADIKILQRPQDFKAFYSQGALISNVFFFPEGWRTGLPELQVNASSFFANAYMNQSA
ncbi:hypothetical protein HDV05_003835, partial [Chytridiales sp. JEL 0842]